METGHYTQQRVTEARDHRQTATFSTNDQSTGSQYWPECGHVTPQTVFPHRLIHWWSVPEPPSSKIDHSPVRQDRSLRTVPSGPFPQDRSSRTVPRSRRTVPRSSRTVSCSPKRTVPHSSRTVPRSSRTIPFSRGSSRRLLGSVMGWWFLASLGRKARGCTISKYKRGKLHVSSIILKL